MDDEDKGDGFFVDLEISPPRYLLIGFFVADSNEQCAQSDGRRNIDETRQQETIVDLGNVHERARRVDENWWVASMVGESMNVAVVVVATEEVG